LERGSDPSDPSVPRQLSEVPATTLSGLFRLGTRASRDTEAESSAHYSIMDANLPQGPNSYEKTEATAPRRSSMPRPRSPRSVARGLPSPCIAWFGTTLGTLVVALLLIPSPIAGAAPLHYTRNIDYHAPFLGGSAVTGEASVGCGTVNPTVSVPPTASLTNGSALVAGGVTVAGNGAYPDACLSTTPSSLSLMAGFRGPPFDASESWNGTLSYEWNVSWAVNASCVCTVKVFSHIVPIAHSQSTIELFGNLFDASTSTWVLGGAVPDNKIATIYHSSSEGNHSGFRDVSIRFPVSLTYGDRYLFYTGLAVNLTAWALEYCPFDLRGHCLHWEVGMASDSIDVGSAGHGATLLAMKVA